MLTLRHYVVVLGIVLLAACGPARCEEMLIFWEAQEGRLNNVKLLLNHDPALANACWVTNKGESNETEWTPLILAALAGRVEVVDYLLTHGADPDLPRKNGQPITMAITIHCKDIPSRVKIITLLAKHGVDIDFPDEHGCPALDFAEDDATARVLVRHGAKINSHANDLRKNVLQILVGTNITWYTNTDAEFEERMKLLAFYLGRGVDLKYKDKLGRTALDWAEVIKNPKWKKRVRAALVKAGGRSGNPPEKPVPYPSR